MVDSGGRYLNGIVEGYSGKMKGKIRWGLLGKKE